MKKCHIYVDGSWLFKQCKTNGTLTKKTKEKYFFINYGKLIDLIKKEVCLLTGETQLANGEMYYFTSVIKIPDNIDEVIVNGQQYSTSETKRQTKARRNVIRFANYGGFKIYNFEVEFRPWMAKAINELTYQEKMVDTALVARFVMNSCKPEYSEDYHVIVTGDVDMLSGIERAMEKIPDQVVLATTNPEQWNPDDSQTSKALVEQVNHKIMLDQLAEHFMDGNVRRCQKCQMLFNAVSDDELFCREDAIERIEKFGHKLVNKRNRISLQILDR